MAEAIGTIAALLLLCVLQVLDDLGVETLASAASAPRPKSKTPQQTQSKEEEDAEDAEAEALAQRLANLKS